MFFQIGFIATVPSLLLPRPVFQGASLTYLSAAGYSPRFRLPNPEHIFDEATNSRVWILKRRTKDGFASADVDTVRFRVLNHVQRFLANQRAFVATGVKDNLPERHVPMTRTRAQRPDPNRAKSIVTGFQIQDDVVPDFPHPCLLIALFHSSLSAPSTHPFLSTEAVRLLKGIPAGAGTRVSNSTEKSEVL